MAEELACTIRFFVSPLLSTDIFLIITCRIAFLQSQSLAPVHPSVCLAVCLVAVSLPAYRLVCLSFCPIYPSIHLPANLYVSFTPSFTSPAVSVCECVCVFTQVTLQVHTYMVTSWPCMLAVDWHHIIQ